MVNNYAFRPPKDGVGLVVNGGRFTPLTNHGNPKWTQISSKFNRYAWSHDPSKSNYGPLITGDGAHLVGFITKVIVGRCVALKQALRFINPMGLSLGE